MGVYALLVCEECKEHLHIGKFHGNEIINESRGLIFLFFQKHNGMVGHTLRVVADCSAEMGYDFGEEWYGDGKAKPWVELEKMTKEELVDFYSEWELRLKGG
jgi:hypothetical protein